MVIHDLFEKRSTYWSSVQSKSEASQFAARRAAEEAKVALLERVKVWVVGWDEYG